MSTTPDVVVQVDLHPALVQAVEQVPEQQISIIVQKNNRSDEAERLVVHLGGQVTRDLHIINAFAADLPAGAVPQLAQSPSVRWLSPDGPMQPAESETAYFYLHNNPYPATEDTRSQDVLILSGSAPQNPALFNYDSNRDEFPGLRIRKGGLGLAETRHRKIQSWRLASFGYDLKLNGQAEITIYAAMKDFDTGRRGQVTAYLYEWDGVQAQTIVSGTVSNDNWSGDWQPLTIDFGSIKHTIPADHQLGLAITVDDAADDHMWFAFGTTGQPSVLTVATKTNDSGISEFNESNSEEISPGSSINNDQENYFLDTLGVRRVWDMGLRGQGVGVAVIDSGITNEVDLRGRVAYRKNYSTESNTVNDVFGHGTHVAGIIGGDGDKSGGKYMGVAPMVDLISVKISDGNGMAYESDAVAALQWVLENKDTYNIRVVNLSVNATTKQSYHASPMNAAAEILWFNSVVVVVSAGNLNSGTDFDTISSAPANDPFVITVGATNENGSADPADDFHADFSARGQTLDGFFKPDILAPGQDIVSILSNHSNWDKEYPQRMVHFEDYFRLSGTSMSAPMVTGAVALLLQDEPHLSPDQVKYRLLASGATVDGLPYLDVYTVVTADTSESANTGTEVNQLLWTGDDDPSNWGSVNWNSVNWNSVNWNSVNWNSVNWNSVNWNSVHWD